MAATRRGPWFGPASPSTVVVVAFVNVAPMLIWPFFGLLALAVLGPFELIAAGLLSWEGYRSRAIGSGILLGFLTTAAIFGLLLARTVVVENVL